MYKRKQISKLHGLYPAIIMHAPIVTMSYSNIYRELRLLYLPLDAAQAAFTSQQKKKKEEAVAAVFIIQPLTRLSSSRHLSAPSPLDPYCLFLTTRVTGRTIPPRSASLGSTPFHSTPLHSAPRVAPPRLTARSNAAGACLPLTSFDGKDMRRVSTKMCKAQKE